MPTTWTWVSIPAHSIEGSQVGDHQEETVTRHMDETTESKTVETDPQPDDGDQGDQGDQGDEGGGSQEDGEN